MRVLSFVLAVAAASCGGASPVALPGTGAPPASPSPNPPVTSAPLFPAVEGEVIGLPGAAVPGLDAVYVATELGWLGPDGDVVFEAVIRWNATQKLGCGILRLGPDGNVNTVLMQDQALPATSGGIVKHPWLVAREIKKKVFELSRKKYPDAKIFGLTTGLAVMKINSSLGYKPVTYSELTTDEEFCKGCQSCVNFDILTMKQRKNCICTAMLYDPSVDEKPKEAEQPKMSSTVVTRAGTLRRKRRRDLKSNLKLFERWVRFKQFVMLRNRKKSGASDPVKSDRKFSLFGLTIIW
jgi:hypothetical protein